MRSNLEADQASELQSTSVVDQVPPGNVIRKVLTIEGTIEIVSDVIHPEGTQTKVGYMRNFIHDSMEKMEINVFEKHGSNTGVI